MIGQHPLPSPGLPARVRARTRLRGRLACASLAAATGAALALGLGSCGSNPHRDLTVTSFSPTHQLADPAPIEVRFDRPVIDEAAVGSAVDPSTVTITPAVVWTGRWADRSTLVIEAGEPLAPSTRYRVALAGSLARRTGGFALSFVYQPLEVEGLTGADPAALPVDGSWRLGFNQRVAAADVAGHCTLIGQGRPVALAAVTPDEVASDVTVRPTRPLAADAAYALTCDGLTGAGGDTPLAPWNLKVRTRSNLFVRGVRPSGWDVAADEVAIEVRFSTPVTLDAARHAVTSEPAIPGLDQGWLDGGGTRYRVSADLATDTEYLVTVAGIADRFGQNLTAPFEHRFHTGDASPRIQMERGIYALEASARGYPIWTRNLARYRIECAPVPVDRLVGVLTTDMNYDPWGGSDDSRPLDWKKLKLTAATRAMAVVGAKNKWHLDDIDLGDTCGARAGARGVYLADVSSDQIVPDPDQPWRTRTRHRVLANVTDLGVMLKVGPSSGLVWVTSLATGKPVAGARIAVFTPQGKRVHQAVTDARGLITTPGSSQLLAQPAVDNSDPIDDQAWDDWDSYRSQRLIAVIEKDGDVAVVDGNWANGIQIWNFGVPEDRSGGATRIRGFIQSDRGLYRPGEQVHFKGLVRELAPGRAPRVPARRPVAIEVSDSRGQAVMSTSAAMTRFGGFSFDLPLAGDAALGDYHVTAKVDGQVFRERFMVEEFRPASFEVKLEGGEDLIRPGQRTAVTVDARYLFGAPVADAAVEWTVSRRDHVLRFAGLDQYSFEKERRWWWEDDEPGYGELVSDGDGTTDAQGRFAIGFRDPDGDFTVPRDYVVTARVTDAADQTIGTSRVVTAHATDLYLGIHTQEYVQAAGMPFAVNLVAVDPRGRRVAHAATLSLIRTRADCDWDDRGFRSYARCTTTEEVVMQRAVSIPATGTATERIYPAEAGDYQIRVATTDGRGTRVEAGSGLWVIGKGQAFWSGDESARMTLVASKPSYQPGDTARLVAQAGLRQPTALITVERDGIVSADVRTMESATEGITLTVADAWAPNVFATVTMVSGRHGPGDRDRPRMKMGVVELKVSAEHKRLAVAVTTDRPSYRPGEQVTGTVTVTQAGKPVAAELSLSVADEGVLQLIAYRTPDPMKTFYGAFGLGVDAATNWNRIARLADPSAGDPDEGGDSAGADSGQRIRSKFVSSAYWVPALYTDGRGQARFTFTAPDNLTAFRLMAVAADTGDRFGSGDLRITVAKPLVAQPALPRFLTVGDRQSVGVVIHNRTGAAGTATVTAAATGLTLEEGRKTVTIAAGGTARVRFAATTDETDRARLDFAVVLGGERDQLRVELPVHKPRVRTTRLVDGGKLTGGSASIGFAPAAGTLPDESEVAITIDRTGLGDLEPSLRYLVEYPYGCLEQTLSRFVPLAKARDLATSMNLTSLAGTRADTFLAAGVAKVIRHQQGDGHFSLWPQSHTYPHLTVYALFGLREASKAGVAVPDEVFERGQAALARWMASDEAWRGDGDLAVVAMAAYLFAADGKPDHGVTARLYDVRARLPMWGQAFLARALHASATRTDKKRLAEVLAGLRAGAHHDGDRALISDPSAERHYYMSSDVRATAMTLAALLEVAPRDPLIDPLVRGLDHQRDAAGRWASTQDNLWSLIGLADYARRASSGTATIEVKSGSRTLVSDTVRGGRVVVTRARLAEVAGGVTVTASGPVHYRVRLTEVARDGGAPVAAGFTLRRDYVDANGHPVTRVKAGDLVTVRLTVDNPSDRRWVALVDPVPAGFEPVNPRLATAAGTAAGARSWVWDHQELRDDGVRWFADSLWRGNFTLSYQVRATIDGRFAAAPATIEAMYQPTVMARTAAATVTVEP